MFGWIKKLFGVPNVSFEFADLIPTDLGPIEDWEIKTVDENEIKQSLQGKSKLEIRALIYDVFGEEAPKSYSKAKLINHYVELYKETF